MNRPVRILFVCHGNICRSVMAQWIMQDLVDKAGLEDRFEIDSAAVSSEETGSSIYPAARRKLLEKGIPVGAHRARQIRRPDYDHFDYIYLMDASNQRLARRILGADPQGKIEPLLAGREIDDPWYSGDFETAFRDILVGCRQRLLEIIETPAFSGLPHH